MNRDIGAGLGHEPVHPIAEAMRDAEALGRQVVQAELEGEGGEGVWDTPINGQCLAIFEAVRQIEIKIREHHKTVEYYFA